MGLGLGLPMLALGVLMATVGPAALLARVTPATDGVGGPYSDAAEIPTDGRLVEALGPAPLGTLGAALQLIVVLACPAICLGIGFLRRFEGRGHPPAPGMERGSGREHG